MPREIPDHTSPWRADLTEREIFLLNALDETPRTMVEIADRLDVPNNHAVREALIGRYTLLEGKGLVRRFWPRGDRPMTWAITFRGRRLG